MSLWAQRIGRRGAHVSHRPTQVTELIRPSCGWMRTYEIATNDEENTHSARREESERHRIVTEKTRRENEGGACSRGVCCPRTSAVHKPWICVHEVAVATLT